MKRWLMLWAVGVLCLGAIALSCNDDDDDDAADDDAADDDAADDDAADDDALGTGGAAQQCLDDLQAPLEECRMPCYDYEELCDFYYCIFGCFATMFEGAVACAEQYPELADMQPYWECNAGCDQAFTQCVEPVDQCDLDLCLECLGVEETCEAGCVPGAVS